MMQISEPRAIPKRRPYISARARKQASRQLTDDVQNHDSAIVGRSEIEVRCEVGLSGEATFVRLMSTKFEKLRLFFGFLPCGFEARL